MQNNEYIEIDLKELFSAIIHKWWIIINLTLIAAIASAAISFYYLIPIYMAETSLFLGKEKDSIAGITFSELQVSNQLIIDYREIIRSNLVTEEVLEKLNLKMDIKEFKERVNVTVIDDSRLFKIRFESTDPNLAADVVNALAQVIIEKAEEIIEVKNVRVIDIAKIPQEPIKPNKIKSVATASVAGFIAGILVVLFMEVMDKTIKKAEDSEKYLGINTIGRIPKFDGEKRNNKEDSAVNGEQNLITITDPKSPAAEAYRSLRTNIYYHNVDKQLKTIALTSSSKEEGKTTTACNLAISMAQVGNKVLLIDADLRKPKVHKYFRISNDTGITNIIVYNESFENAIKNKKNIDNLFILPCGSIPPNPAEIISSNKMKELLDSLYSKYDIIIFDTPPVAQVTDASILGGIVDGVILVLSSRETNIQMAKYAKKSLLCVNTRIIGSVLTKMDKTSKDYYYTYY